MRCRYCQRRIGFLRQWKDRHFCCGEHRKKGTLPSSARIARDAADLYGYDEPWLGGVRPSKSSTTLNPGTGLLLVAVTVLLLMILPSGQEPLRQLSYMPPTDALRGKLIRTLPGKPSTTLRDDFRLGLRNWTAMGESAASAVSDGWSYSAGVMRLGHMRLWKPTLEMGDYQFEFEGQVEKKAMGWVFRASNSGNYYGTKITASNPGQQQRAEVVRYVMQNGHELRRLRLPIPIEIHEDSAYTVRVRVKGDRFTTTVNGQLVDVWSDKIHRAGGVGFYSDPGEQASLRWVSISDRESFLQRFLSLSFLIAPADLMGTLPPL